MAAAWEWIHPRLLLPLSNEAQHRSWTEKAAFVARGRPRCFGALLFLGWRHNRDAGLLYRIGAEFLLAVILEMDVLANPLHQKDAR